MRGKVTFDARLRPTSSADSLPWLARVVTLLRVGADGLVTQAKTDSEKRAMLGTADEHDLLVVAWPGEWSQDLFVVDDLQAARLAVGLPRRRVVASPAESRPQPHLDVSGSGGRSRDLWGRLAELPDLPPEGRHQLVDKAEQWISARGIQPLLARSDLGEEARQRLLAGVRSWDAAGLVADACCTAEEALELLDRFPAKAEVLGAALRRTDIEQTTLTKIAALSSDDAATLWQDSRDWPAPARTRLAPLVLDAVLASPPSEPSPESPGWHRRSDPETLLRELIGALPSERRTELFGDPHHGSRVRRAFLAAEELSDHELLGCLPELKAAPIADLLGYLRRFPRIAEVARDEAAAAVARLLADGWDPGQAARAGQWADLAAVARAAGTPACIDALATAAAIDGSGTHRLARYQFVDAIIANPATTTARTRRLLEHLPDEHIRDIEESLPARSRTRRLCAEVVAARHPRAAAEPAPFGQTLPSDEELAATADPAAVLAGLLLDRSRNRDAVLAHVLGSAYMTDELAWRLPVREIERHPVYGPRLAAKVAEICGDSPGRWRAFAAAWGTQTQLLATTLFKRIEAGQS